MHVLICALALTVAPPAKLPLKSLMMYENGIGYFERKGPMSAGATAEIPLEPGQLDDALKSMVVVSDKGVASIEFAPALSAEAARAMAGMPDPEAQRDLATLLRSLQGVEVKVATTEGPGGRGRVVQVAEESTYDVKGNAIPAPTLLLFGDAGLLRLRLAGLVSVRPVDAAVQLAWDRATGSMSAQPERQSLKVRSTSAGGTVGVGYTTEAPVWRTTYRLVSNKDKSRLQGFALVHNDSDEAWDGVRVTLASGHPTSFLFPLAGPRYGRREMLSPEDGLDTAPQLATAEAREHLRGSSSGSGIALGGIGTVGHGSGGGGYGSGYGSVAGIVGHQSVGGELLADGPSPLEPAAVSEAGELFLYTVAEPVFLGARKSALLPIIDSSVDAEPVTVIDGTNAWLAMRLTNSTPLTLEGGTISLYTEGAYAGEAQVDRIKPKEVRVVRHGEDLDLELTRFEKGEQGVVQAVRRNANIVELHRIDRTTHTLKLTSRSEKKRTLLVQLASELYRVTKGAEEDVRSPGQPRFARLTLQPKEKRDVDVVEEGAVVERVALEALTSRRLDTLLAAAKLSPDVRTTLAGLRAEALRAETATARLAKIESQMKDIELDGARLRDDLAAAGKGGATRVAEELGKQLLALEEQLKALRAEREEMTKTVQAAREAALSKVKA